MNPDSENKSMVKKLRDYGKKFAESVKSFDRSSEKRAIIKKYPASVIESLPKRKADLAKAAGKVLPAGAAVATGKFEKMKTSLVQGLAKFLSKRLP